MLPGFDLTNVAVRQVDEGKSNQPYYRGRTLRAFARSTEDKVEETKPKKENKNEKEEKTREKWTLRAFTRGIECWKMEEQHELSIIHEFLLTLKMISYLEFLQIEKSMATENLAR